MKFHIIISTLTVLFCSQPVNMMGGLVKLGAIIPTPVERGVPSTAPPEQEIKVAPTYYKDHYKKTRVVVTHPVSTVLYDPSDYFETPTEVHETSTDDYEEWINAKTSAIMSSMRESVFLTNKYDEFEWPVEAQTYTKAINMTAITNVTTTVMNSLPFM